MLKLIIYFEGVDFMNILKENLKKEIIFLQNKLNNSINNSNGNLGNDDYILKISMELDELINRYMKLIFHK